MLMILLVVLGGLFIAWGASIIAVALYLEDQTRFLKLMLQMTGWLLIVSGGVCIHYG